MTISFERICEEILELPSDKLEIFRENVIKICRILGRSKIEEFPREIRRSILSIALKATKDKKVVSSIVDLIDIINKLNIKIDDIIESAYRVENVLHAITRILDIVQNVLKNTCKVEDGVFETIEDIIEKMKSNKDKVNDLRKTIEMYVPREDKEMCKVIAKHLSSIIDYYGPRISRNYVRKRALIRYDIDDWYILITPYTETITYLEDREELRSGGVNGVVIATRKTRKGV